MKRVLYLVSVMSVCAVLTVATLPPRHARQQSNLALQDPRIQPATWLALRHNGRSNRLVSVLFSTAGHGGDSEQSGARRCDVVDDLNQCWQGCQQTDVQCRNTCTSQHPPSLTSSALYDCWKGCDAVRNSCKAACNSQYPVN